MIGVGARGRHVAARWLAVALAGWLLACARHYVPPSVDDWNAGTHTHRLNTGDASRSYILHIPAARRRNRVGIPVAYPLVVVLHGSGADGEVAREQSGMDRLADSLHFLVAYPNGSTSIFGLGADWNAGKCCGNAARTGVDDVGFVEAIVSDVGRRLPVDPRRVFVAGFSDGGRMAYHIGCDASTTTAAIAVVSGSLVDDSCTPTRAVPMIAFHGTADTEVPYDDTIDAEPPRALLAASAGLPPSVRFWAAMNQCQAVTSRREAAHVLRVQFGGCAGADVLFYSIDSGAHAWPGGAPDGSDGFQPTPELRASDEMIRFFFQHPLR